MRSVFPAFFTGIASRAIQRLCDKVGQAKEPYAQGFFLVLAQVCGGGRLIVLVDVVNLAGRVGMYTGN
jgi:hypothetical protein